MEFLGSFLQERWFVVLAVVVALFIVVKVVKTVIKWVLILAIVAGLFIYGANYKDQLIEYGTQAAATITTELKEQALKVLENEVKEAKYEATDDGFIVKTRSLKIQGTKGSSEVELTFMNQTFRVKADTLLNGLIEKAKENAGL